MQRNEFAVSFYTGVAALLLGLLVSSTLAPFAQFEHRDQTLRVYGFFVEYSASGTEAQNAFTSPKVDRLYMNELPEGRLRTYMMSHTIFTGINAFWAFVLLAAALLEGVVPLSVGRPTCSTLLWIFSILVASVILRFALIAVMGTQRSLYKQLGNGTFSEEGSVSHACTGFSTALASLCVGVVAAFGLFSRSVFH